jgi:4'-phosphopantetheinyl transferase
MLRRLLGGFLGLEPERVELRYGPHGKPCVEGLRFNLAHSHELALYAFSRGRELGVDLERIRPLRDAAAIAERYFSAEENAVLRSLPEIQRHEAFFRCWTRKEAYLKALGDGLARPLDSFDVTLAPGEPARLLRVQGAPDEAARWSLLHLDPAPGFVGALAAEGPWGSTQLFQAAGDLSAIERIVRNTSFES